MKRIHLHTRPHIALLLFGVMLPGSAVDAFALEVLVSADGEGKIEACSTCRRHLGGIAKRSSAVTAARQDSKGLLLVDAGNFLLGHGSLASGGKVIVDAYNVMAYDAANVSYRDFREGKDTLLKALASAKFAAVSANLFDAESGKPLFKPYAIKEVNGKRVAIIGITESPDGLDYLPHLQAQLQGVRIALPGEAVAKALAKLEGKADRFVLLFYGSAPSLARAVKGVEEKFDVVAVGGANEGDLPQALRARSVVGPEHGRILGRAVVESGKAATVSRINIVPTLPQAPEVEALVKAEYERQDKEYQQAKATAGVVSEVPAGKPKWGTVYTLRKQAENRGLSITATSVSFPYSLRHFGPTHGTRFLRTEMSFASNVAMDLVLDLNYPQQVRVASLSRNLFAVLNGKTIVPVWHRAAEFKEHLPDGFTIHDPGRPVTGTVIFELPATAEIESLELRFYHDQYAPIVLPLRAAKEGNSFTKPETPLENSDVELAVYDVREANMANGRRAKEGWTFVTVDLGGRSRMAIETDAMAWSDTGKADEKVPLPKVMEYQYVRDLMHLVADGHVAYGVDEAASRIQGGNSAKLFFLPDGWFGYELTFLVPKTRTANLELHCFFPEMKFTGKRTFHHPKPITLKLRGDLKTPEPARAIAVIRDKPIQVGVMKFQVVDEFNGFKYGKYRVAVIDFTLKNTGKQAGLLTIADRLTLNYGKYKDRKHYATSTNYSDRPPLDPMYMYLGAQRSFQLTYLVRDDAREFTLGYKGVSLNTTVPLSLDKAENNELVAKESFDEPVRLDLPLKYELEPVGIEGFGINGADVNKAIDTGRDALWKMLQEVDMKSRRKLGHYRDHGLVALALVHCGAHEKYPEFDKAVRELLETAKPTGTYEVGFYCMLTDAYGDPKYYPRLRLWAQALVNMQGPQGRWGYNLKPAYPEEPDPALKPGADPKNPAADKKVPIGPFSIEGGEPPAPEPVEPEEQPEAADDKIIERETDWNSGSDGDHSTTQYAALGLRSAERRGFKVPQRTWQRLYDGLLVSESKGGGWPYGSSGASYGSMACAGLSTLAIAGHFIELENHLDKPPVNRALRWLDANFSVNSNPKKGHEWYYYYLYSVERVGQLINDEFIGKHEWYPMGVKPLLAKQDKKTKLWKGAGSETEKIATSFALLFLTRATEKLVPDAKPKPKPKPKPTGPGKLVTEYKRPPSGSLYIILDASGSMLAKIEGKRKFDIARDAVVRLIKTLPDGARVALRVYGHRKFAIHDGADEDTNLEIPMGTLNRDAFLKKLTTLRPRGKTPLALSLEQAVKDLRSSRSPVTVLLITDGGEDTLPRRNPAKPAALFAQMNKIDLRLLGFDINRPTWTKQLKEMARVSGGTYVPVSNSDGLAATIGTAAGGAPPGFVVLDKVGKQLASDVFGAKLELPPGHYRLRIEVGSGHIEQAFWINAGKPTLIEFDPTKVAK